MPVKEENTRTTITISKELDAKIDKLANLQNVSRNAVIVNLIQMSIDAQISLWQSMKDPQFLSKMINLASNIGDEQLKKQITELKEVMNSSDSTYKENIAILDKTFEEMK